MPEDSVVISDKMASRDNKLAVSPDSEVVEELNIKTESR